MVIIKMKTTMGSDGLLLMIIKEVEFMSKFHITKDGKVAPCKAETRGCPLGGQEVHFENKQDAEEYIKQESIKTYGLLPKAEQEPELVPGQKVEEYKYYVRTDRNGTKIFHDYRCPRCGGAGGSKMWEYTGFTCYSCGGSGKRDKPRVEKLYTKEYQAKLDKKKIAAYEKKLAENPPEPVVEEVVVAPEPEVPKYESQYIGVVGEKTTTKVEITDSFSFNGSFGRTYVYKMRDEQGNLVVWMTGSPISKFEGFKEMTATVKSHQEYEGERQTSIIRPKFK